ncbi:MAG: 2-hydroxychromene-2-carboxylate isomerase [Burkholderiales bacterium]|nr:2-hydroxychromene-2-carboxylate isomerase [Burkholderiales bacterium]
MAGSIDFYFDFSSPYGYLAAEMIEAVGQRCGRGVNWHPILLGVIFKTTGGQPLTMAPMKGPYSEKDFRRSAAYYGIPYKAPSVFPIAGQNPSRAVLWMQQHHPEHAKAFALELYRAFFRHDRDISKLDVVGDIAAGLGHSADDVVAATQSDDIKNRLKANVEAAIAQGVFGSPYFIVDGEPFWGADRLPMMEQWIQRGGWSY